MDVGIQMVLATYGWQGMSDDQAWDEAGAAGRRARLRCALGRRASLQRLLVLPRQSAADGLSGRALSQYRPRHRSGDPAVERAVARRREGDRARHAEQGTASP